MKAWRTTLLSLLAGASVIIVLASAAPASAQGDLPQWTSYAVKFVCGVEWNNDVSVMKGRYRTIINIHNPHYTTFTNPPQSLTLTFFKKAVLTFPQHQNLILPPSCRMMEQLRPDHALAVNCRDIKQLLSLSGLPTAGDLEGFLVIEVPPQFDLLQGPTLDVVAVYTARKRPGLDPDVRKFDIETMDVERVPPTEVIGLPDFLGLELCESP